MGIKNWFTKRREYGQFVSSMNFHWSDQNYIALDMETTGLDIKADRILSVGWTQISQGSIKLKSARHMLLSGSEVDTAAIGIHLITDSDIKDRGIKPRDVMKKLQQAFSKSVLIAHHAPIEIGFLKKAWLGLDLPEMKIRIIDTMALEAKLLHRKSHVAGHNSLTLATCRKRYGLPQYLAHDALTDAIGVGELLMAQATHLGGNTTLETLFRLAGKEVTLSGATTEKRLDE